MLGLIASLAAMAPAAAASPPAPHPWQSEWSDDTCSLTLPVGDPAKDTYLAIRSTPAVDGVMINLINAQWTRSPVADPDRLILSVDPGGNVATSQSWYLGPTPALPANLDLRVSDRTFLDRFAAARVLQVADQDRPLARFVLPAPKKAVSALRACEDEAMRRWQIDPAAWRSLRSGPDPVQPVGSYISYEDYPNAALRANATGRVVVKLTVDPGGKPSGCAILASSANDALDSTTCAVLVDRARFTPALDAGGKPVAAPYVAKITWTLQD